MTQFSIIPPAIGAENKSGIQLAADLSNLNTALNSTHEGTTTPTYAGSGLVWSSKTGDQVNVKDSVSSYILGHRPITSIADLRNFGAGLKEKDVVRIQVSGEIFDYYWDATSEEADNGTTIILPAGWTDPGRWKRLNREINLLPEKTTLVDNDIGVLEDSEATNAKKKFKLSSVWTYIKSKISAECAFRAYPSANIHDLTGDGTIATVILNSTEYNIGSCYNTTTGEFTAPKDGVYHFDGNLYIANSNGSTFTIGEIVTGGGVRVGVQSYAQVETQQQRFSFGGDVKLDSGDKVTLRYVVYGTTKTVDLVYIVQQTNFSGHLVREL